MKRNVGKKRLAFILVAVCLVGLIGIGISYSYYLANISTSNEANKNSNITTTTITKVVMDMQGKVSSDGAYPGHKMVKEVVVRGIGESNSLPANVSIQITPDLGEFSDDVTWKLYKSEEAITCNNKFHNDNGNIYEESSCDIPDAASLVLEGSSDSDYVNIAVNPNTEIKYYLVVEYVNKTDEDQSDQMSKSFSIDIGLDEYKKITGLKEIIASVDKTGKCPSVNDDGTVNVTKEETTDGYLCSAEDAYGTSYYYRGNVTNNYVKFANKYWRIVRINGDRTVRVIYDGTSAYANGENGSRRQIGYSVFNTRRDDNMYVGYMYGDRVFKQDASQYSTASWDNTSSYYVAKEYTFNEGSKTFTLKDPVVVLTTDLTSDYIGYYTAMSTSSSSSYNKIYKITSITAGDEKATIGYARLYSTSTSKETAQINANDSAIKIRLDNWYKTNILGTNNERYLADNIFCNDRSISSRIPSYYTNKGYGTEYTAYRWNYEPLSSGGYNSKMMLICPQQNDAFTVNDTTYGNGALTYPIGLITTDEVVLAGGWNVPNSGYYLYSGQWYWTFSSHQFYIIDATMRGVNDDGSAFSRDSVTSSHALRPVLNLSPEVLQNGDGSMENPYTP